MHRKRRSLVLTNEACRHPFRASLPPRTVLPPRRARPLLARMTAGDTRDFLMAFTATFVAVSVFIG